MTVITAVHIGHDVLAPILDPLHRALQLQGERTENQLFRVEMGFDAKAAADIGGYDAQPVLRQGQEIGQ